MNEIKALSPFIARGLRSAAAQAARVARGRSRLTTGERPALIVLDEADGVVRQSKGAPGALGGNDALCIRSGLAHVLRDVASRSRRGRAARVALISAQGEWLRVSAVQLGRETALLIDESSEREATSVAFSSHALTPRERAVSRLLLAGQSNQDIANELAISLHTTKDHVKKILAKSGCKSRLELALKLRGD